jgi:hypothetical protein
MRPPNRANPLEFEAVDETGAGTRLGGAAVWPTASPAHSVPRLVMG